MDASRSGRQSFQVGQVLSRTFAIWARNVVPFTILSVIIYSPLLVYAIAAFPDASPGADARAAPDTDDIGYASPYGTEEDLPEGLLTYTLVLVFGGYALGVVTTGAFVYGVFEQIRGQPAGLGACLRVGLSRLLPVLVVGVLAGLLTLLGLVLLIVPGIILACMYWVAVPVAVVEKPGLIASLRRSAQLTSGVKGSIFAIVLLLIVLENVVSFITDKALGPDPGTAGIWVPLVVTLVFGSIYAVASAVGYHDLRVSKEGVVVEDLVRVFA